ncbi:hypothetical protein BJ546DRAFT_1062130 [Cryomyces antarcticus]|nr:hypothetical protein LTR04_005062 [Oleoguttula sp. CCFEE 6159]
MDFGDYSLRDQGYANEAGKSNNHIPAQRASVILSSASQEVNNDTVRIDQGLSQLGGDTKPRLTKDQHDILEDHFQKQNKPNTSFKKDVAEALGVPLDKINNWFQNRRAKVKQDAKKAAGMPGASSNMYYLNRTSHLQMPSPDTYSPSFCDPGYYAAIQDATPAYPMTNGLGIIHGPPISSSSNAYNRLTAQPLLADSNHDGYLEPMRQSTTGIDSHFTVGSNDDSRNTLTQEYFIALAQREASQKPTNDLTQSQDTAFTNDADMYRVLFGDLGGSAQFTPQDPPVLGQDKTSSSSPEDGSPFTQLSASDSMQSNSTLQSSVGAHDGSSGFSDWTRSRTSSLAVKQESPLDGSAAPMQNNDYIAAHPHNQSNMWQPGQSVPSQSFSNYTFQPQTSQASHTLMSSPPAHVQQAPSQPSYRNIEDPLTFPDGSFSRRESSASMLAHSLSAVELQPQQRVQHHAQMQSQEPLQFPIQQQPNTGFKQPNPPSSIAVRRQRPRPAALGPAALGNTSIRSTSYSGTMQASPNSNGPNRESLTPGQPLRRIKSTGIGAGFANGRVQKVNAGSAQRSPLHPTFAEAANSPRFVRHVSANYSPVPHSGMSSNGSVSSPTPLSPRELPSRQPFPPWQNLGPVYRQPSIHETEETYSHETSGTGPSLNSTSPPVTPSYGAPLANPRFGHVVATENTPPQSAPASQLSFSSAAFVPQPQPLYENGFNRECPEMNGFPHYRNLSLRSTEHQPVIDHARHAVPMVNEAGVLGLAYPPPFGQSLLNQYYHQNQVPQQYPMLVGSNQMSPSRTVSTTLLTSQALPMADFQVHEYSPPHPVAQSGTPRKSSQGSQPKNYIFANQGPGDFRNSSP